jgi:hypothetical protein
LINGSVQIILSIADESYIILSNNQIEIKKPIILENYVSISSKNYNEQSGYKLYINGETSYLDIDKINVRHGIIKYTEVTIKNLKDLIQN